MKATGIRGVGVAAALALVLICAGGRAGAAGPGDASDHPWIGEPAPSFSLPVVGGGEMGLEGLEGRYLVIHFGTSW